METVEIAVTKAQIIEQIVLAEVLTEQEDTQYPDNTYEEGVLDALNWILLGGNGAAAPLDIDLYQDLINKEQA